MALLALIWGGSFLASRAALEEVGVFTIVGFRVGGAAVLMWIWVIMRARPVPRRPAQWLGLAGMGLLNAALPFSLIVWGQTHIPSGLAAILNAATAVFGVVIAALIFRDERLAPRRAIGVGIGFAGVATAIGLRSLAAFDPGSLGQLAVLGAALSYGCATALGRVVTRGMAPEAAAAGMLSMATLMIVPLALGREGLPGFDYHLRTWAALCYSAGVATALAYILYFIILARSGAGNLSLVTLMIPPVALIVGALAYGEALPGRAYLGFGILALGLLLIDGSLAKIARSIARGAFRPRV